MAPSDIDLVGTSVAEHSAAGTVVGSLSATDSVGDIISFSLADSASGRFAVVGSQLRVAAELGSATSYSVIVRATDSGGLYRDEIFVITISQAIDPPTDISLTSAALAENLPSGTVVGMLSAIDRDAEDHFVFSLVSGSGSGDNNAFTIVGASLKAASTFNFEFRSSYSIRVRATDKDGLYFEKQFAISVMNVNEAPTSVQLLGNTISDDAPSVTIVGNFSTSDPDGADGVTYSLVPGAGSSGNSAFSINSGSFLFTAVAVDYASLASYDIRVRLRMPADCTLRSRFPSPCCPTRHS